MPESDRRVHVALLFLLFSVKNNILKLKCLLNQTMSLGHISFTSFIYPLVPTPAGFFIVITTERHIKKDRVILGNCETSSQLPNKIFQS